MPKADLSDNDVADLVAYIKSYIDGDALPLRRAAPPRGCAAAAA